MPGIRIFVAILFLAFAIYLLYKSRKSSAKPIVPTPVDPVNFGNCVKDSVAGIELKACSTDTDCDNCGDIPHKCEAVDTLQYYGSKSTPIPKGNWCLPQLDNSANCNKFTSVRTLSKIGDTYGWICTCNDDTKFTKKSAMEDCTVEVACGNQANFGKLVDPRNGADWNGTWEPELGVCKCNDGYRELNGTCEKDTCLPGKYGTNGCQCPIGHIRCEDLPYDSWYKNRCKPNTCITDPCQPGGIFNTNTGKCECDASKNFFEELDATSIVNSRCTPLCVKNGPCGERGTCTVDTECVTAVQAGKLPASDCTQLTTSISRCQKCTNCKGTYTQDKCELCNSSCMTESKRCAKNEDCCSNSCSSHYVGGVFAQFCD